MANGIVEVHAKQVRGRMMIIGKGKTPRGQSYIANLAELQAPDLADKAFKSEAKAAVRKMLSEIAPAG